MNPCGKRLGNLTMNRSGRNPGNLNTSIPLPHLPIIMPRKKAKATDHIKQNTGQERIMPITPAG